MVSIVTAVFVIIGQGFRLTLEYRESEATLQRKRDVDEKLKEDLKIKQKLYLDMERAKGNSETILFGHLEELGTCAFLTRSLTSSMLESMTRHIKSGLRYLAGAIVMLAISILTILFGDFSYTSQTQAGSGYPIAIIALGMLAVFGYEAYVELGKHFNLREHFVKLSENPNLQYAEQIFNELTAAHLF